MASEAVAKKGRSARCFNGAAGSHRRMEHQVADLGVGRAASMGPPALTGGWRRSSPARRLPEVRLQWGRRLSPADGSRKELLVPERNDGFNGAAGSHRRMANGVVTYGDGAVWLQWGRRLSPADGCWTDIVKMKN